MKKIVKGVFVPLVISMVFGFVCGKLVYRVYGDDVLNKLKSSKLYLIQNGEYLTYDNMREENNGNNYVYYKDEDGYKTVVGITRDEDNIDKIKKSGMEIPKILEFINNAEKLMNKKFTYTDDLDKLVSEIKENV